MNYIEKNEKYIILARDILDKHYENPKFYIETAGCQQNEADSEKITGMACDLGYSVTDKKEEADLILLNTCAVREQAELKSLSHTGHLKHLKEKNTKLIVGLCGCMVQQDQERYGCVWSLLGREYEQHR